MCLSTPTIGSSCYPEELDHRQLLPAHLARPLYEAPGPRDSIATAKTLMTSPMLTPSMMRGALSEVMEVSLDL